MQAIRRSELLVAVRDVEVRREGCVLELKFEVKLLADVVFPECLFASLSVGCKLATNTKLTSLYVAVHVSLELA